jgi:hypothetical protein
MMADGYRIFLDGDMWCAVGPGFVNLQESPAGFGSTPILALRRLLFPTLDGETADPTRIGRALDKARQP